MSLTERDRLDIVEMVARYIGGSDRKDPSVADLFAENGVLEANGRVLGEGREGIRAFAESGKASTVRRRHVLSNSVVDGDGSTARISTYVTVYDVTDGQAKAPYLLGEYNDELVKLPEGWRFTRRSLTTIATLPS